MSGIETIKTFLKNRKRDFTARYGRMGRSRFFVNLFAAAVLCLVYTLLLRALVSFLADMNLPGLVYNNIQHTGVGALFLFLALCTRRLRLKRLRDSGLPAQLDWPFLLLLLGRGLGSIFHMFELPYLESMGGANLPSQLGDFFAVLWLAWLLLLLLAPSKSSELNSFG
ncbi:MAG: hypothetical protein LBQ63_05435 [Deltaproteobacteria bacterium]|jgi:uncharacterized membrane protein YhaH (DUF805 family)|nr:hypothetical protein [Deltaproteobacteria bacterium]